MTVTKNHSWRSARTIVPAPITGRRRRHNLPLLVGGTLVLIIAASAMIAPLLSAWDPTVIDPVNRLRAPVAGISWAPTGSGVTS